MNASTTTIASDFSNTVMTTMSNLSLLSYMLSPFVFVLFVMFLKTLSSVLRYILIPNSTISSKTAITPENPITVLQKLFKKLIAPHKKIRN